jgi:membrane protein implicated in regulation of membrane protease activity
MFSFFAGVLIAQGIYHPWWVNLLVDLIVVALCFVQGYRARKVSDERDALKTEAEDLRIRVTQLERKVN